LPACPDRFPYKVIAVSDGDEDIALLRAWQAGDASAGDALVRKHFSSVYRFFRGKLPEAAEELAQRTFLGAVQALPRLDPEGGLRPYLFGIARRQLFMYLRTRARNPPPDAIGSRSIEDFEPSPSRQWAGRQEQMLVWQALRKIPIDLQITLELHYWEDMTVAEIAQVLEVAPGTIKSRLHRARTRLAEIVQHLAATPNAARATIDGLGDHVRGLKDSLTP
jgi:RNA polymerase sigma factor (sigma-70 family)